MPKSTFQSTRSSARVIVSRVWATSLQRALARAGSGALNITSGPASGPRPTEAMPEPRITPTKLKKDLAEMELDLRRAAVTLRAPEKVRVPPIGVAILLDVLADWLLLLIDELSPPHPRHRPSDG